LVGRRAEGVSEQAAHCIISERAQADTNGTIGLQQPE